ncbi:hypothetical protein Tco_0226750 [Tanacetum coccineum]
MTKFPQIDSCLAIPVFTQGDDPIACLNKAMDFLITVASSRVTVQQVQGRQGKSYGGTGYKDEEKLEFLADPGILDGQAAQITIPNNVAFQTKDLDAYDSDCDDVSNAKAMLKANISNYGSDVILEVLHSEPCHHDMDNQSMHAMQDFEQTLVVDFTDNKITSDSNIILYSQYLQEMQQAAIQEKANQEKNNESLTVELEKYKERVKTFKQRLNIDLSTREKMIDSQMDDMIKEKLALKHQIDSLEQNISNQIKEKESLLPTFTIFKSESKEKESKHIQNEIDLEKKIKKLDNIVYKVGQSAQTVHMLTKPQVFYNDTHKQALGYQNMFYLKKAQRIKPTLYDGSVISSQHVVIPVIDDEETLILEEVSRSKMLAKQNDLISKEKKVNTTPINYVELNRLLKDFSKRFVSQKELSVEQDFWLQTSHPNTDQSASSPVKIEALNELPKVSQVNTSLKKLKYPLGQFDTVVKKRITPDAITKGEWGFEYTKSIFLNKIIPFLKSLKDIFNDTSSNNQNALEILEYFKNKDLKAQLQAKDTTICKLKEHIKSMRENNKEEKVKQEMDEIKTINIELEHSVAKLLSENECLHKEIKNLKKIYKDQFDSIKKTRALSKEHCDSFIAQLNSKSMENAYLKGQIQEKVFVTTILQNELRRLKGKLLLDNATTITNATTIPPRMFKLDIQPLSHRLKNNRDAHEDYLKKTIENTDTIRGLELLVYVSYTCPSFTKPSEILVAVTTMNKVKKVRFSKPLTSSSNIHKIVESSKTPDSNTPVLPSTGLKSSTSASRSQRTCNKKNDRISQTPSSNMKNKEEVQRKRVNLSSNKKNRVKDPICDANVKHTMLNANSELICDKCKQSNLVPSKETTSHSVETQKLEIKVYSRRPKQEKYVGSSKKAKIVESKIANNSEPNHSWGSKPTDVPSSSTVVNDSTLNKLAKYGLARDITKLKFKKDHLCSSCALGKSKKSSHQPKAEDTNQEKLYLLHMDLYGPMHVESINGIKSKDEAPDAIIKCIKNIQGRLNAIVHNVRSDNGTEFVNQTLLEFYENLMYDKKSDLSFLHVFGSLCYLINDSEDMVKLNTNANIDIFVGCAPAKKVFRIYNRRTMKIMETIHVMFDELMAIASEQFSPGPGLQLMTLATSSLGLDHPIENVIGDPSRSVSTRKQLQIDAMWCYFDAFLTSVELKNYKEAMLEPSWIDAMQEEIHEFERLQL